MTTFYEGTVRRLMFFRRQAKLFRLTVRAAAFRDDQTSREYRKWAEGVVHTYELKVAAELNKLMTGEVDHE